MIRSNKSFCVLAAICGAMLLCGCATKAQNVNPIPDDAEKKKPLSFAAYAAGREYPADAEKSDARVTAEVDYQLDVINFVNLGDSELNDVEVWVNEHYVMRLGTLPVKKQRGVNFSVLYDKAGQRAPSRGTWVNKVELYLDGKLHSVTLRLAD